MERERGGRRKLIQVAARGRPQASFHGGRGWRGIHTVGRPSSQLSSTGASSMFRAVSNAAFSSTTLLDATVKRTVMLRCATQAPLQKAKNASSGRGRPAAGGCRLLTWHGQPGEVPPPTLAENKTTWEGGSQDLAERGGAGVPGSSSSSDDFWLEVVSDIGGCLQ